MYGLERTRCKARKIEKQKQKNQKFHASVWTWKVKNMNNNSNHNNRGYCSISFSLHCNVYRDICLNCSSFRQINKNKLVNRKNIYIFKYCMYDTRGHDKGVSQQQYPFYLCSMTLALGTSFQNWASSGELAPALCSISAAMTRKRSWGDAWNPARSTSCANHHHRSTQCFFPTKEMTAQDWGNRLSWSFCVKMN